jgi:hypothetical protein
VSLLDRDEASHQALAAEMLYRGVLGVAPPTHPEFSTFIKGFTLPCRGGFSFPEVCEVLSLLVWF